MISVQAMRDGDDAMVSVTLSAVGSDGRWSSDSLLRTRVDLSGCDRTARAALRAVLVHLLEHPDLLVPQPLVRPLR
jgi:hypothetical protein